MTSNINPLFMIPQDVMIECAKRVRELRIQQQITQKEIAQRVGVAEGTIKRFEKTGEVQFRTLLSIALVLGRLPDFVALFNPTEVPASLYHPEHNHPRQRARKK